ncbi:MAG: hypothetical protein JNM39_02350 [Bdellovibrionaceae bacterium]|nr:hypothetical protein [Pseudobdellovibrionaceae bacterium]
MMLRTIIFAGLFILINSTSIVRAEFDASAPFLSKSIIDSLGGVGVGVWARDGAELEVTYQFACKDTNQTALGMDKAIYKKLTANDYEMFKRMSKCKNCDAMDGGEGPMLMKWNKVSHAIRMNMGYLTATVESERLTPKEIESPLSLNYGADLMDDIYFDTDEFHAISNQYGLRARKRWDSASYLDVPSMRRILVGLKQTPPVNSQGLKTAYKIDDRFDMPNVNQITEFAKSVPYGVRELSGKKYIIPSVLRLHQGLKDLNLLKDEGSEQQVLQLKPKTFLRSLRLRFHYNGVSVAKLYNQLEFGKKVAASVLDQANKIDPGTLSEADRKLREKIITLTGQLSDMNQFVTSNGFSFEDDLVDNPKYQTPGNYNPSPALSGLPEATLLRAIPLVNKIGKAYRELGYSIEKSAHWIAKGGVGSREAPGLRPILFTMSWANPAIERYRALPEAALFYRNFLGGLLSEKGLDAVVAEINATGAKMATATPPKLKDFKTLTAEQVAKSLARLEYDTIEEAGRQVEEISQTYKSLLFNAMGASLLGYPFWTSPGNIFIDTFDIVGMFKAEPLEVNEYNPKAPQDPPVLKVVDFNLLNNNHVITEKAIDDNLIGTYISNDVQLELGNEKAFLDQLKKNPTPEKKALIDWMMAQFLVFQKNAAKLKVLSINSFLSNNGSSKGGCSEFQWKVTDMPKGESSLLKLKQMVSP